ncbi:Uncharacterised protein [Bordetella pertussis]|nr:Uncharacterised protein [Bordetella pertussis]CFW13856.1 Uncharacterised protein [Bordetella pertussis]CFW41538.1 Uncharacterised protein [Bordetella pertussis]CPO75724.1 Uncharacterised protein [Bordetella pertussis]
MPMTPPPITSRRRGISLSSSAPVESMMRGSSGRNGRRTGREPTAMTACLNATREPSDTARLCGPSKRPVPVTTSTLRWRASPPRPPHSLATSASLCARSLSRRMRGSLNSMPSSLMARASSSALAQCSSALEGMQPTFRQTPPRVGRCSTSTTESPRSAARNAAV